MATNPAAKPDPAHCSQCGPTSEPPRLTRASEKQREFKCAKCGHVHIVGLPASVTKGS